MEKKIKNRALKTLSIEAQAIKDLSGSVTGDFIEVVKLIFNNKKGKVVVTGIGKSANIAAKIVATFNSTGTPAVFMHAADAIHGDLGIVGKEDVVIAISKSGETPEIRVLVPLLKARGNTLVAMVGNSSSYLALQADYLLDVTVAQEACPNNLAPTASTTAQLAMGDALAVCLLDLRGFTPGDFAKFHPGGALGKRMYYRVADLYAKNPVPVVAPGESMERVILEISSKRLGATAVVDNGRLLGIITDGDLRRMIEKHPDYKELKAQDIMTEHPKVIEKESLAIDALTLMRENNITQLPVLHNGKYTGIIHLHDILKEGIF